MTIKALYPTVRPTLNLDFAKTKALDPRVTYTRATSGTYVGADGLIKTAAANVPRFDHNPVTGESLGLLVEEARTNNLQYSEQFDNAAWTKVNLTVTANSITAPDNNTAADTLLANGVSGQHWTYGTGSISGPQTCSIFVKAGTQNFVQIMWGVDGTPYANFNLLTGSVASVGSTTTASIQAFPNGWYRCTAYTSSSTAAGMHTAFITSGSSGRAESNSLSTFLYIWGAQVEAGAFPTSYIPTGASGVVTPGYSAPTVTRAADVASMTGTNFSSWYNQSAGSFFVNANHKGSSHFNNAIFLKVNNGTTSNQIKIFSVGADPYLYITYIAAEQAYIDAGSVSVGLPNKYAAGFTVNNFALSVNGATAVTDTSGTSPMDMTQLTIGARLSGVGQPNGTIARLAYYPVRLPDAQLQALTAT
jgi:hypothetical protein